MKLGAENKKKLATLAGLSLLLLGAIVYAASSLFGGSAPPAQPASAAAVPATTATAGRTAKPASGVAGSAAKLSTSAELDPTLKMDAMLVTESLAYSGNGRNIFSASSLPVDSAIPDPLASARLNAAQAAAAGPAGPPPPPPIDLKYFGVVTSSDGKQKAWLLKDDNVFVASEGDIVQRRYKIVTISDKTVLVEDLTDNNRQTLPRQSN